MKGKIILFIGLLMAILLIASCAKKNAVGPDNANLPEMNLPSNFGTPVHIDSTRTVVSVDTVKSPVLARTAAGWPLSIGDFFFPTAYGQAWKIVCGYGCYKHTNTYYPAAGYYSIDLVRAYGTTEGSCVTAPARGIVVYAGWMSGYGWCVVMDHDYGHTGQGYKSIVAHLKTDPRQYVNVGNDLLAGTILGYCGSTETDSPHVHFGVWKNNQTVPLNGISGYANLVVGGVYYSYCWPVQPPRGSCNCP
jgi:murein DD-endopeptidase MepM/ murein hydrolase activator NlpD